MSPTPTETPTMTTSFPRVSGDEPGLEVREDRTDGFSPREWG